MLRYLKANLILGKLRTSNQLLITTSSMTGGFWS